MSASTTSPVQGQPPAEPTTTEVTDPFAVVTALEPWWWLVVALLVLIVVIVYRRRRAGPDPEVFERRHELPVRATVPVSTRQSELRRTGEDGPLAVVESGDIAVESMRSLRTALHLAPHEGANRVVAIVSPKAGQGRSFVAANLAAVLAETGGRVLLVDGDLRNGSLHRQFGLPDGRGLAELLAGDAGFGSVICGTGVERLELIPAGCCSSDPQELLNSRRFALVLKRLTPYRHIVIDTPPLAAADDALPVTRLADVALMVLNAGRGAEPGIARLREENIALHGVVFNRIRVPARRGGDGRRFGYA